MVITATYRKVTSIHLHIRATQDTITGQQHAFNQVNLYVKKRHVGVGVRRGGGEIIEMLKIWWEGKWGRREGEPGRTESGRGDRFDDY